MADTLRELAEEAIRSAFDPGCQSGHALGATWQTEPHYVADRKALFDAIDAAEADVALLRALATAVVLWDAEEIDAVGVLDAINEVPREFRTRLLDDALAARLDTQETREALGTPGEP